MPGPVEGTEAGHRLEDGRGANSAFKVESESEGQRLADGLERPVWFQISNGRTMRTVPGSLEEKVVCYADKLAKWGGEVAFGVTVEEMVDRLGGEHPSIGRMWALHGEITGMLSR